MAHETWTYDELFEGLDPAPSFVSDLERLGLLRVVARDGKGAPLYGPEAREQLDRVLALVELGYQPKDIAAIARRVGLPGRRRRLFRRTPTFIRLGELARRSGLPEDTLKRWMDNGHLDPEITTESGDPLFPVSYVELVGALDDLTRFGLEEGELGGWAHLVAEIAAREADDPSVEETREPVKALLGLADERFSELRRRLDGLRMGIRRWDKLLSSLDRRLDRLRRAHKLEVPKQPRRRARRRLRTRTRRRSRD